MIIAKSKEPRISIELDDIMFVVAERLDFVCGLVDGCQARMVVSGRPIEAYLVSGDQTPLLLCYRGHWLLNAKPLSKVQIKQRRAANELIEPVDGWIDDATLSLALADIDARLDEAREAMDSKSFQPSAPLQRPMA